MYAGMQIKSEQSRYSSPVAGLILGIHAGCQGMKEAEKFLCFDQKSACFSGMYLFDLRIKRIEPEHQVIELFLGELGCFPCGTGP